jgi:VanZ like family
MRAERLVAWGAVVLWAGVIFALSSIPDLGTGLGTWDLVLRKLAHLAEYAVFGALLYRALRNEPAAIAIGSLYAITDEVHQSLVAGREGSALDWAIDSAGVAAGVLLLSRAREWASR